MDARTRRLATGASRRPRAARAPARRRGVALERGLALMQPERVKEPAFLETMRELEPWVAVVVAFGQIFPQSLLDIPTVGCVNLHGSLLPKYRGAAPIHAAIAAGERVTGVTTMKMERGLDSGPMLLKREVEIGPDETTPELSERMADFGAALTVETLERLASGDLEAEAQDDSQATYAPQLKKEDGRVDWALPAVEIYDRLRAYTPWPGLTAQLRERPLKLVALAAEAEPGATDAPPGTFLGLEDDALRIACGEGSVLRILSAQRPGKRAASGRDLANGERFEVGESFA